MVRISPLVGLVLPLIDSDRPSMLTDESRLAGVKFWSQPYRCFSSVWPLPLERQLVSFRRDVAQPGRALAWGARGRQFKSARPDQSFVFPLSKIRSKGFRPAMGQGQTTSTASLRSQWFVLLVEPLQFLP